MTFPAESFTVSRMVCFTVRGFLALVFLLFFFLPLPSARAAEEANFIGYSYPYAELDLHKELGGGAPIVVEMFTTPACIFCPVADRFFGDLIKNAPIIGISCPVDHLDVKVEPIGLRSCTQRHYAYAASIPATTFTPLLIVNGREPIVAYLYGRVLEGLRKASRNAPLPLAIAQEKGGTYAFDLPAVKMGDIEGFSKEADIVLIEYRKPFEKKIKDGDSARARTHYTHMASAVVKLEDWDGKPRRIIFPFSPSPDSEGAAILVQNKQKGIIAAGEIRLVPAVKK